MSDRDCNTDDIKPIEESSTDMLDKATFNLRKAEALLAFLEDYIDDLDIGTDGHTRAEALIDATRTTLVAGIEQLSTAHTMVFKERTPS